MKVPLIYHNQPIFGFDLGTRTAKMIQLRPNGKSMQVVGYGYANFPGEAIVEGIIVDPQEIADALAPLMKQMSFGKITATRVAASLPVAKVFTRVLELPQMAVADLGAAVRLEAEQYVPVPLPDLYVDYEIIDTVGETSQVLMVAAPRAIVDSYLKLFELMNLEVIFIESSLAAVTRAVLAAQTLEHVTLVVDIGAGSIDLTIWDKVIRLTDTVALGGDNLTLELVSVLGITREQANEIKARFGLGESNLLPKIEAALRKPLSSITAEIRRVIKFYQDRGHDKRAVENIILTGGSASMPGLVEYLARELELPVTVSDPWAGLELIHIQDVSKIEAPMYTTALGLARLEGKI
ncbi:type IV pilus assembly protein PilM [Candidatus Saccharibacteria bacterium]|nr:type IV pilus assembly protein PilM [Candidatus Saccharibacteria bacterium]